jgi:dTDP-glucose 4,6-dehydratase
VQTILVTGSLGLIGSTLVKMLKDTNVNVITIDIRDNAIDSNILNYNVLQKLISNCTGVIHLAAISRVIWGEDNPELCKKVNVEGTKNVVNACVESTKKPWLIYASSREVYGQQDIFPVNEDCVFQPHNQYAKSKIDAENIVTEARETGLKSAILRFSNVYGGMSDYSERVIPAFCWNAINNQALEVNGKDSLLDFTFVDDVARGIAQVVNVLSSNNESLPAIHFTTGKTTSLFELANLIIKLTNSSSDIKLKPKNSIYPSRFYGDYSRAKSLLNWQPTNDIKSGLINYIERLKAQKAKVYTLNMVDINENFESNTRLSAKI